MLVELKSGYSLSIYVYILFQIDIYILFQIAESLHWFVTVFTGHCCRTEVWSNQETI